MRKNWHTMTLMGKVLIFVAGFGFGFGVKTLTNQPISGNNLKVEVNGKVKQGSDVNVNIQDANKQTPKKEERKKFLGIF